MVAAGQARLPGVIVSVTPAAGGAALTTSTGLDGRYHVTIPGPGRYVVKAELAAFATVTKEVSAEAPCQARLDIVMTLASRVPAGIDAAAAPPAAPAGQAAVSQPAVRRSAPAAAAAQAARPPARGAPARSVRLPVSSSVSARPARATSRADAGTDRHDRRHAGACRAAQPAARLHARDDVRHGDRVRANGPDQRDAPVRTGRHGDVRRPRRHARHAGSARIGQRGRRRRRGDRVFRGAGRAGRRARGPRRRPGRIRRRRGGGMGGGPAAAGRAAAGGGGGGRGGPGRARRQARAGQSDAPGPASRWCVLSGRRVSSRRGALLADRLPGRPSPNYLQQRFTGSIGGQFKIPKLFDLGTRTSYFLNYSGNRSSNFSNAYSTVPNAGASQRRLLGSRRRSSGSAHAAAVPRQRHSGGSHRSLGAGAAQVHPAAEPGRASG